MAAERPMVVEQPVRAEPTLGVAEAIEPAAPPARKARQPKAPRRKAKVAEVLPVEEAMVVEPVLEKEPAVFEPMPDEEPAAEEPMPFEEEHHASVTPLFEPVPFARQQRTGFGRKSGLAFRR